MSMVGAIPLRMTGVRLLTELCAALIATIAASVHHCTGHGLHCVSSSWSGQSKESMFLMQRLTLIATWTPDKRWHICLTGNEATLHKCGPCPLLAYWLHWIFAHLRVIVVPHHCWHFVTFGITDLVQSTDSSHTLVSLKTNLSCFWLSGIFAVWQMYFLLQKPL